MAHRAGRIALELSEISEIPICTLCALCYAICVVASSIATRNPQRFSFLAPALPDKNEVVMPSLTYRRMADIAAWADLIPHFCDVDVDSLGMTAKTAANAINENTALILGVHPITNLCDIEGLEALSYESGIPLLFDSVEAAYAEHNGKMVGGFGRAEAFSLHASKVPRLRILDFGFWIGN